MGAIRIFLWLVYEINKWGMNLYWILYLRWLVDGNLTWFAHFVGIMSFIYMISNIVYIVTGTET